MLWRLLRPPRRLWALPIARTVAPNLPFVMRATSPNTAGMVVGRKVESTIGTTRYHCSDLPPVSPASNRRLTHDDRRGAGNVRPGRVDVARGGYPTRTSLPSSVNLVNGLYDRSGSWPHAATKSFAPFARFDNRLHRDDDAEFRIERPS